MEVILREHLQFHYNKKMERLLIRVPLLLVEWLNPVGSGAMFLLYHKKLPEGSFLYSYTMFDQNIFIIPQKTASQFWAGSLVRVPPLALTLIVTYFN